jgi:hypothetical protein
MSISVESRKRLWGRSGGKCAVCKEELFETGDGYDTIIGEEAHIIARSPGGPRREFLTKSTKIDDYSNLILLCPRDHKIVDAQPAKWTVSRLIEAKSKHEKWIQDLPPEERPMKVLRGPDYWTKKFFPIIDGPALWGILSAAHSYKFGRPTDADPDELDFLAGTFDTLKDWGEVASEMHTMTEEREAERALEEIIEEVANKDMVIVGRRVSMIMTGGIGPDTDWSQAEIQVWRLDQFLAAVAGQQADNDSTAV